MNIDAQALNETLTNQIEKQIRRIIHHNQVGFNPGMQIWFDCQKSNTSIS